MEYSADFRRVQITMNHCNEFIRNFDKIVYYGGLKQAGNFDEFISSDFVCRQ